METQIILLLCALRLVSAELLNIPPAPTLPNLDISSLPEYMQRLLANRPSVIYVDKSNNHEAGNGNGNILHDHVNYQIPGQNIGIPKTNGMNQINNQGHSLDHIKNVNPEPLYVPPTLRKPHTYGMHLRGDKGEIWNHVSGSHFYVDFAPKESIHPKFLHNKEDEPNHLATNDNKYAIHELNNHYKHNLPSVTTIKPELLEATSQVIPEQGHVIIDAPKDKNINNPYHSSISNLKSDFLYYMIPESLSQEIPDNVDKNVNHNDDFHQNLPLISTSKPFTLYYTTPQPLAEEIPNNVEVQKDENVDHNDDSDQTFPLIPTSKPDTLYYTSPQPLSEEIPAIVVHQGSEVSSKENENSVEIQKETIENTISKDKIEQSLDDISATTGSNKENRITQSLKTFGMNLTGDHGYVWNDLINPGMHYNVGELETSDTTNPTTEEINPFEKLRRRKEDTPSNNMKPELDDWLKKDIEKIVKKEVSRQIEKAFSKINTDRNNGSENNNGGDVEAKKETNNDNKNAHNNYGSIIGSGKVTNLFVFYPINGENPILSKPVNEILYDNMLNKDTNENNPDHDVLITAEPTALPAMIITAEPNPQHTIFTNPINMRFEKYKENEITANETTAATSQVDVTTIENVPKDQDNQTTQNASADQDDAKKLNTYESTAFKSIKSSIDDESTTAKESPMEDIKTRATMTENSFTEPSKNSSAQEIDSNNETPPQSTATTSKVDETTVESAAIDQSEQATQNASVEEDDAIKANTNESTTAKESSVEDIKPKAAITERSFIDPSKYSSEQDMNSNNETTPLATTLSKEAVE